MKFAPSILGGVLFFIGLLIGLSIDFPQDSPANVFGFSIQESDNHVMAIRAAHWAGVSLTLMVCGVIVPLFLQWDYSRKGTTV